MELKNTKAFMAHIPLSEFDYLEEIIQEYDILNYLIGFEEEPYNHYHFVIEFNGDADRKYHNFCKRVFKDKYKLRGQATKGKPRQYGCLSRINNLEKMLAYSLKQLNFRTNMKQEDIDKYIEISRDNSKILDYRNKILKHLRDKHLEKNENHNSWFNDTDNIRLETLIKKEVIRYVITDKETKHKLTKSFIDNLYMEYIQFHTHLGNSDKIDIIYNKFYSY